MGEYASLTVWKELDLERGSGSIFERICDLKLKGVSEEEIYKQLGLDFDEFGDILLREINSKHYFSYRPMDFLKRDMFLKEYKYNIPLEWLLCFHFDDFKIEGDDSFGKFVAQTRIVDALKRLLSIRFIAQNDKSNRLKEEISKLLKFLSLHQRDELLIASSDMIYYSSDGDYGVDYVKNIINQKVKTTKEMVSVPHWRKQPSA